MLQVTPRPLLQNNKLITLKKSNTQLLVISEVVGLLIIIDGPDFVDNKKASTNVPNLQSLYKPTTSKDAISLLFHYLFYVAHLI